MSPLCEFAKRVEDECQTIRDVKLLPSEDAICGDAQVLSRVKSQDFRVKVDDALDEGEVSIPTRLAVKDESLPRLAALF